MSGTEINTGRAGEPPQTQGSLLGLLAFAGNRRALTYVGCGLSMASQVLGFAPFICIWMAARELISVAPNWAAASNLALYGWAALVFAAASILVYFAALLCTHLAAFRCAANIRKQASAHLMRVPLGYFDTHATGELRRIIDGCAASTETLLAHLLPDTAGSIAMVVGTLVILFVFDWRLGLACLVPIAISMLCMLKMMGGEGMEFMKRYQSALVRMNKTGTEYVRGIPVVKVFQQTVYSFKAFHDAIEDFSQMAMDYAVKWCQAPQVVNLTALNGLVVFLVPLAILLAPGEGDLAAFTTNFAFYAVFSALIPTVMTKVMFMAEAAQMAGDATERVRSIMDAPVLAQPKNPKHPQGFAIEFEHVSFVYGDSEGSARDDEGGTLSQGDSSVALLPQNDEGGATTTQNDEGGRASTRHPEQASEDVAPSRHPEQASEASASKDLALDDVSFTVSEGATVALVGPSGGGKTTAASLVPRFWDVCEGEVRVGGVDVRQIEGRELMANVAFVFQTNQLFCDTLLENVRAAKPDATREEALAALAAAQCNDIVAKLPQGVDTLLGVGGAYLSGGEIQRVALARAILKDAPVVVLDEATAFADPENEALIQQAFARLAKGRTVLMIAHRLSTVVNADKIVVLDAGRVAEQGTHNELLATGGLYSRMWADYEQAVSWRIEGSSRHPEQASEDVASPRHPEQASEASASKDLDASNSLLQGDSSVASLPHNDEGAAATTRNDEGSAKGGVE